MPLQVINSVVAGATLFCTQGPAVGLSVTPIPHLISAGSTNTSVLKDRINQVASTAVTATDYKISPIKVVTATYRSTNPGIPIDPSGLAPYVVNGHTLFLMDSPAGIFTQPEDYFTSNASSQTNFMGFVTGSLASNLNYSVTSLASGKGPSAWNYNPNNAGDLATNATVWTSPASMAVSSPIQVALVAQNAGIGVQHYHYSIGQQITFSDTNGIKYSPRVIGLSNGPNDFLIYVLESNLPPAVVPAAVLPLSWSNHISSLNSILSCWAHLNTAHMDMANSINYPAFVFGGGNGLQLFNAVTNIFGNEIGATGGDSSSPAFFILGTTNIILFATSSPGDAIGDFVSDPAYFNFLTNTVPPSALNILDLSGYPSY